MFYKGSTTELVKGKPLILAKRRLESGQLERQRLKHWRLQRGHPILHSWEHSCQRCQ